MSYTIVSRSEPPQSEIALTVMEALALARELGQDAEDKVTILSDSGWVLTLEELENLIES